MHIASWWKGEGGSAHFLWIFPVGYLVQSWDGVGTWIKEAPLIWMRPQMRENDPSISLKATNKISKMVARSYIKEVVILALKSLFLCLK